MAYKVVYCGFTPAYNGPLDKRNYLEQMTTMRDFPENQLYSGISTVINDAITGQPRTYQWSKLNSYNPETGRWRLRPDQVVDYLDEDSTDMVTSGAAARGINASGHKLKIEMKEVEGETDGHTLHYSLIDNHDNVIDEEDIDLGNNVKDIEIDDTNNVLKVTYLDDTTSNLDVRPFFNSTSVDLVYDNTTGEFSFSDKVVITDSEQELENKTIDAEKNTISNLTGDNLKPQTASDRKKTWVVQDDGTWDLGKAGSDYDNVTIEEVSDKLQVKDSGISTDKIADDAVTKDKIDDDAKVVYEDDEQTLTNKTIDADDNTISDIVGTNFKAQTSADRKKTWVWSGTAWELGKAGSDYDDVTIEEVNDKLQVKDSGISTDKIEDEAVTKDKIDTNAKVVYENDTQTLTNKTLDIDSNTLSNVEVDNFKASALDKAVSSTSTDNALATGKAVYDIVKIAGHTIQATVDTSTYVMTFKLLDKEDNVLSTQTIDLPVESLVLNVEYVDTTEHPKALKITLQNGTVAYVPLGAIINGLVPDTRTIAGINLQADITAQALENALKEVTATYKNKSISGDDNTITNLTGSSFKAQTSADAKKTWVWNGTSWVLGKAGTEVDDVTIEEANDKLQIKDSGVTTSKIADEAVTKDKIDTDAEVVFEDDEQTLTNKTIDVDSNTLSNLETDNFKTNVLQDTITNSSTNIPTSKGVYNELPNNTSSTIELDTADTDKDYIDVTIKTNNGDTVISKEVDLGDKLTFATNTQTLTNKSIDADNNDISNIELDNFKVVDPAKVGQAPVVQDDGTLDWEVVSAILKVHTLPTSSIDEKALYYLDTESAGRVVNINGYYGLTTTGASQYQITSLGLLKTSTGTIQYDWTAIQANLSVLIATAILKSDNTGMICQATVDGVQGCYYKPNTPTPIQARYVGIYQFDGVAWNYMEKAWVGTYYDFQQLTPENGITYYVQNYQETPTQPLKNAIYKNGQFYAGAGNVLADISMIDFGNEHHGDTIRINNVGKCEFVPSKPFTSLTQAEYDAIETKDDQIYFVTDSDGNKETEISDADSQKYATTKVMSNYKLQTQLDELLERVKASEGAEVRRQSLNVTSIDNIGTKLTNHIQSTYSRAPRTGDKVLVTLNDRRYADYVYGETEWISMGIVLDQDITDDMLSNTWNVANVNHTTDGVQSCLLVGGNTYRVANECTMKTPITNINTKVKIYELPFSIGAGKNMMIKGHIYTCNTETQTDLIAQWYQAGGSHYINPNKYKTGYYFMMKSVVLEYPEDPSRQYGTQQTDADGHPVFNPDGSPRMVVEDMKVNVSDTDKMIWCVLMMDNPDGSRSPVPKSGYYDKNGNQAWMVYQMGVVIDTDYMYKRDLYYAGCPINQTGRVGQWQCIDNANLFGDLYYNGTFSESTYAGGTAEFKNSWAMETSRLSEFRVEDDNNGRTSSVYKPNSETCRGFELNDYIGG